MENRLKKKIVILFSGNGTNLENIIKSLHKKKFENIEIEVVGAICNKSKAYGLQRAKNLGIKTFVIEHKNFKNREEFDEQLVTKIKSLNVDLVVLAGFMRILSPVFTQNISSVINIHPSILPLFKGEKAMEKSFDSDMKIAGVSVHFVNEELDGGEIISQMVIQKISGEGFENFQTRMQKLEYEIYPKAIIKVLQNGQIQNNK